ncbi:MULTISPECIES: hypothetical protein [Pseudomonas]|uniref:hypothetical protein n=1 Tax=Pseudomonas TaxID=286 RepID=UPI001315559B|nr:MULTISPECIES: hypothetical protein [Pseudomonas]MEB2645465.1 hypothetical protein [Pseudomonas canadensis]
MMTVSYADKTSYLRDGLDAYGEPLFSVMREPHKAFSPQSQHRDMQIAQEGINPSLIK